LSLTNILKKNCGRKIIRTDRNKESHYIFIPDVAVMVCWGPVAVGRLHYSAVLWGANSSAPGMSGYSEASQDLKAVGCLGQEWDICHRFV
jgi:hypothetical protein